MAAYKNLKYYSLERLQEILDEHAHRSQNGERDYFHQIDEIKELIWLKQAQKQKEDWDAFEQEQLDHEENLEKQLLEIEKYHQKLNDDGTRWDVNTVPWLILELWDNALKLETMLNSKDRAPKRRIKPVLDDLQAQIRELYRRFN